MKIEKLINKFYLDQLTNEELAYLIKYLKDEEPQHEILVFYQSIWDKTAAENNDIDSQELYNLVINKLSIPKSNTIPDPENTKETKCSVNIRLIMQYAAIFFIAFGLSWLVHPRLKNNEATPLISASEQTQIIEAPYGSKTRIILPDSSIVVLNSGSILKYSNSDFNTKRRSVELTGEGFFSVTKNSSSPFYVTTPGIIVKVLGTTFNVKAYTEDNIEEATLVSGKIEIYASSDKTEKDKPIILKPNQSAQFLKSEDELRTIDHEILKPAMIPVKLKTVTLQTPSKTVEAISWKENTLVFNNESFKSLIVKIERWYDVKIEVDYPELNSARVTGKFDKETLEQVLNALRTVTPFDYNIKQNKVSIYK